MRLGYHAHLLGCVRTALVGKAWALKLGVHARQLVDIGQDLQGLAVEVQGFLAHGLRSLL